jgi:N-formylglutamate deformylase
MNSVGVIQGLGPIILGLPHTGTYVPDDVRANLNDRGQELSDTDWHIDKLYADLLPGVTTVRADFHRYVIDANRDPSGASLYPGQNTTSLVPLTDFDGHNIWVTPPDEIEIERRRLAFHTPYHTALHAEMERVHARHGIAILYDSHSIRSRIPFLFEGVLPDFNIGTNSGSTCVKQIETAVHDSCIKVAGYSSILNGRFKGGWTTRHYGQPDKNWHAIQMELAQSTYLKAEVAPWIYDDEKSAKLRIHLKVILSTLGHLALQLGHKS